MKRLKEGEKNQIPMDNDLIGLINDPELITSLQKDEISCLLGELEALRSRLWSRLMDPSASNEPQGSHCERILLTVDEAAEKLAFKPSYLYELIRQRLFPAIRHGKYIRIRSSDLQEWVHQRQ
jgi:excisionase family DNA binding protein